MDARMGIAPVAVPNIIAQVTAVIVMSWTLIKMTLAQASTAALKVAPAMFSAIQVFGSASCCARQNTVARLKRAARTTSNKANQAVRSVSGA